VIETKGAPKNAMKVIGWLNQFGSNLRTLRTLYNGLQGHLNPHTVWTRETMARVAWDLHKLSEKLLGMGERAEKWSREVGKDHGYQVGENLDTHFWSLDEAKKFELEADGWKDGI
jgi:hypothetical protein